MSIKILVVDDDEEYSTMVRMGLQQAGYDAVTVHNGQDALDHVASDPPSLVLLDVEMPGISGFEVLEQLRGNQATAHIPVLMLTARGDIPDVARSLHHGAVFHLTKPFTVTELLSLINNFPLE